MGVFDVTKQVNKFILESGEVHTRIATEKEIDEIRYRFNKRKEMDKYARNSCKTQ